MPQTPLASTLSHALPIQSIRALPPLQTSGSAPDVVVLFRFSLILVVYSGVHLIQISTDDRFILN